MNKKEAFLVLKAFRNKDEVLINDHGHIVSREVLEYFNMKCYACIKVDLEDSFEKFISVVDDIRRQAVRDYFYNTV